MGNSVILGYEKEGIVCPAKLRKGIFTVGATDNIDFSTTSQTAKDEFHGTGCSIMQIFDEENEGKDRGVPVIRDGIPKQKSLLPLPAFCVDIPPLVLKQQEPYVPTVEGCTLEGVTTLTAASDLLATDLAASREKEYGWLQHVCSKLNNEQLGENDYLS